MSDGLDELAANVASSALRGSSQDWQQNSPIGGYAVPWHVPLPTTPESTGVALGGIGSSYNLNGAGRTAATHFLDGKTVFADPQHPIELHDFYFAERDADDGTIEIRDPQAFFSRSFYFPLVGRSSQRWLTEGCDPREVLGRMLDEPSLLELNLAQLERWGFGAFGELQRVTDHRWRNQLLLSRFYSGSLTMGRPFGASLLAGPGERNGVRGYSASNTEYAALFPAVCFRQASSEHDCTIERLAFSPVAPGKEWMALPLTLMRIRIGNPSSKRKLVTLLWLQENLNGFRTSKLRSGRQDAAYALSRTPYGQRNARVGADTATFAALRLSAAEYASGPGGGARGATLMGLDVSSESAHWIGCKTQFYSAEAKGVVAEALGSAFIEDFYLRGTASEEDALSGALCVTCEIAPGAQVDLLAYLVLDYPDAVFSGGRHAKKYTELTNCKLGDRAEELLARARKERAIFASETAAFQSGLRDRLRQGRLSGCSESAVACAHAMMTCALSNLTEASCWLAEDRFLMRECVDYPFFNSLDVYFYGSFALTELLPHLDQHVLASFRDSYFADYPEQRAYWLFRDQPNCDAAQMYRGPRKPSGVFPHDLGSPFDDKPNAYDYQNPCTWKDLGPKFALLVYRQFKLSGDRSFLRSCAEVLEHWVRGESARQVAGLALPSSRGITNTYDNLLNVAGVQVYDAQLWLAGLRAYQACAQQLGLRDEEAWASSLFCSGQAQLLRLLWDDAAGIFAYSTAPITDEFWQPARHGALIQQLRLAGFDLSEQGDLSAQLNGVLYSDHPTFRRVASERSFRDAIFERHKLDAGELAMGSRSQQLALRKLALHTLAPDCWTPQLLGSLSAESDAVFADQLIGDFYLGKLGLPRICSAEQLRRVLEALYRISFVGCSPILGVPNLVSRQGAPLPSFQAQEVWVGINFTLVDLMLEQHLDGPAEHLLRQLFEAACVAGKIPFGIPEGFNCTFRDAAPDDANARALVERLLQSSRSCYEAVAAGKGLAVERWAMSTQLRCPKFTAGRYTRPGSIAALSMASFS